MRADIATGALVGLIVAACGLVALGGWRAIRRARVVLARLLEPHTGTHLPGPEVSSLTAGPGEWGSMDYDAELDWYARTGQAPPDWWREAHAGWEDARPQIVTPDRGAWIDGPMLDDPWPPYIDRGHRNPAGPGDSSLAPGPAARPHDPFPPWREQVVRGPGAGIELHNDQPWRRQTEASLSPEALERLATTGEQQALEEPAEALAYSAEVYLPPGEALLPLSELDPVVVNYIVPWRDELAAYCREAVRSVAGA
jgi:hypothetical protein